jgi:tetratricopeptide (TPR) repeat protein
MVAADNPNAPQFVALLVAQEASSMRRKDRFVHADDLLIELFDNAIEMLSESKQVQFEDLANEQAGFSFARRGRRSLSVKYFERALQIYKDEWGSLAKYNWLKERSTRALAGLQDDETSKLYGRTISMEPQQ